MGLEIDIRLKNWEDAQQKVHRGEIDAITTMAITEELYDFSEVTLKYQYSLFVRTEQVGIQTKEDLEDKAVAVTEGGLPRQVLESIPGIKFVFVEDYVEGFRRFLAQEFDAVAADRWVGAYSLPKAARARRHSTQWIGWPNSWCIYREGMNTPSAITATAQTSRGGYAKRPRPMITSLRSCPLDCLPRNSGEIGLV